MAVALLPHLRAPIERAQLNSIRLVLETNRGAYDRAIALGREALAELGHPVCGDKVYRIRRDGSLFADHSRAPRLALLWRRKYLRTRRPPNTSTPSTLATVHGILGP